MTDHPITPPPELVSKWASEFYGTTIAPGEAAIDIATQAAQWGADQELEVCCNYVDNKMSGNKARELRAIRRPKPPSLKEQALNAACIELLPDGKNAALIIRALEALPDE